MDTVNDVLLEIDSIIDTIQNLHTLKQQTGNVSSTGHDIYSAYDDAIQLLVRYKDTLCALKIKH